MDNPLESTGLLREGQAVELFNRRDYAAAALVFEDVAKKVSGVERGHYYTGLLLLPKATRPGTSPITDRSREAEARAGRVGCGFSETALAERAWDPRRAASRPTSPS